ncbi:MAG TPA: hypothetical protein VIV60_24280 [Polyangiaceae bacterium]
MFLQVPRHIATKLTLGLIALALLSSCGGDDQSSDTAQQQLCEQTCGINFCPSDLPAAECKDQCRTNFEKCPNETKAALECRVALSRDKFACSQDAVTYIPDETLCGTQATAAWKCLMGK